MLFKILSQYEPDKLSTEFVTDALTSLGFAKQFMDNNTSYDLSDETSHHVWIGGIYDNDCKDMLCDKREDEDVWDFTFFPTDDEQPQIKIASIELIK